MYAYVNYRQYVYKCAYNTCALYVCISVRMAYTHKCYVRVFCTHLHTRILLCIIRTNIHTYTEMNFPQISNRWEKGKKVNTFHSNLKICIPSWEPFLNWNVKAYNNYNCNNKSRKLITQRYLKAISIVLGHLAPSIYSSDGRGAALDVDPRWKERKIPRVFAKCGTYKSLNLFHM